MKTKTQITFFFLVALSLDLISCRSNDTDHNMETASVKVSISRAEFNDIGNLDTHASIKEYVSDTKAIQHINIPFNDELTLTAEFSIAPTIKNNQKSLLRGMMTSIEQENLSNNIKYKVVVYDANGLYITERDYTRGQESNTQDLNLNGGEDYTFVAYSIGSTSELPKITFSDPDHKTLSTSSLEQIKGSSDLMYFKKDMQLSANENSLDIIFKHQFSQINTTIDASSTGYTISAINAVIDSHYPNANIELSNANITRTGNTENAPISFSALNSSLLIGAPRIVNASTDTGSLIISSITIGSQTKNNLTAFSNLKIIPGTKYNLKLTITPVDGPLVRLGVFSMRVGGKVWMRHNLGADTNLDPDQSPTVSGLIGNYYQFGRANVVATVNSTNGAISGWNTTQAPDGSWNSGTDANPVKTSNDPCPSGWRIPTRTEIQQLIDNTIVSNIGTWTNSSTVNTIGAAKVFISKTNHNAKLTFPATGYRTANNGTLAWRGGSGDYWSSVVTGSNNLTRLTIIQNGVEIRTSNFGQPNNFSKTTGLTIRCIEQ
ncbi:hypothetical protein BAS09_03845 [Elizabethkingia ursingii]|uniref:FISUMP domain-containing protein n=1 Tax=Elizabethkingia ursingii TaxID=1756150 RepID=UPI00099A9954|nr:FISUMP domain-containing protein [Elizabethkingia ursingii]OPC04830.1 hypothetical protein BAS09_03845 [Elizabethkingia ursingii]